MERENIELRDAPATFFDQVKWAEFLGLFHNDQAVAVAWLSKRTPEFMLHIRECDLETLGPRAEVARLNNDRDERGHELVRDFVDRLSDGSLRATGMWRLERERNLIPAERWKQLPLRPNFLKQTAERWSQKGVEVFAEAVLISETAKSASDYRLQRCLAFLKAVPPGPNRVRKIAKSKAREVIPGLTDDEFRDAYKAAFGLKPGRPRKVAPENI